MKCTPKEICFRVEQTRYVDVVVSSEHGYEMPTTVQEVLDFDVSLHNHPLEYVDLREQDWVSEEIIVKDLEFKE